MAPRIVRAWVLAFDRPIRRDLIALVRRTRTDLYSRTCCHPYLEELAPVAIGGDSRCNLWFEVAERAFYLAVEHYEPVGHASLCPVLRLRPGVLGAYYRGTGIRAEYYLLIPSA
jgi:hypothetical protein